MTWQRILIDGRLQLRFVPQMDTQLPAFNFDTQRATCEDCEHCVQQISKQNDMELRCDLLESSPGCSLVRLPGQACGPGAERFQPRSTTASEVVPRLQHTIVCRWSEVDLQLLRANYAHSDTQDLAIACRKTLNAVYQRASKLGLKKGEKPLELAQANSKPVASPPAQPSQQRVEIQRDGLPNGITSITRHFLL